MLPRVSLRIIAAAAFSSTSSKPSPSPMITRPRNAPGTALNTTGTTVRITSVAYSPRNRLVPPDKRAIFVGVEPYLAAGGTIERDLFDDQNEGYLTDPALLVRLPRDP